MSRTYARHRKDLRIYKDIVVRFTIDISDKEVDRLAEWALMRNLVTCTYTKDDRLKAAQLGVALLIAEVTQPGPQKTRR